MDNDLFSSAQMKRYQSILWLILKHGRTILSKPPQLELDVLQDKHDMSDEEAAQELTTSLEELGPTFIKLGQTLSMRSDLLPQVYLDALSKLQDDVEAMLVTEIVDVIESELGAKQKDIFMDFSPEPLATASLGQVHAAKLHDGREIVVKVQRPGVRKQIISDLNGLQEAAEFLESYIDMAERLGVMQMLDEFRRALLLELDYKQEAQNLRTMKDCLKEYSSIVVPQPVDDYTTSSVLTMEMIHGVKVTSLDGFNRLDRDTEELAADLFRAYLDQILVHGFVHTDPHPGNIFLTHNTRLALLDLGMTAHVDPSQRVLLLKLLLAISEGRGKEAAELGLEINTPLPDYNRERATRQTAALVAQTRNPTGIYRKTGRVILELARIASDNHIRPAPELVLLGRTFLYLDPVVESLAPDFNPAPLLERHVFRLLKRQARQRLKSGRILANSLEMQDLLAELPRRINRMLGNLARNSFQLRIDAVDETRILHALEKMSNRLTVGLVLSALIVGAALLMNIESRWTLFGYPVLALVLFLGAACLGLFLVISILFFREK